jgi:type I restriction enzyme M protein
MLDTATKKRIDDCRDILVGKLPDPKAQIEQITIALIYKFMADMDKEAIELGGQAKFFADYKVPDPEFPNDRSKDKIIEFSKYAWDNLLNPKVTATEMLTLYTDAIVGMDKNPNIPQLFRDIFKNAYLPYRDPETLKLFLKTIAGFEYSHSEKLGDAFEYLLQVMGSQGDAGQFRTPRHIIDFLVEVVDPSKTDTILDPACGTAGFLISAFKHIKEKNNNQLTPDERKKLIQNFVGYDISPDMVRLSLVNLYLHGFSDPHIFEYDTLSSEERWDESFDVILANPPFMSPKGGIRPHKKFTIQSKRSEVLFVDYIAEHLNPNGKAGIIVPEGIIFQSATSYKDLRKLLVKTSLWAVVSLPSGVFNPYSGVKTSILLLDKALAKKTDKILFVKIENDGLDLGAQRRPVKGNEMPEALDTIQLYKKGIEKGKEFQPTKLAYTVYKKRVAEKGDYNLSGERYKDVLKIQTEFELVKLSNRELFDIVSGGTPSSKVSEYWNGNINWATLVDLPSNLLVSQINSTARKISREGLNSSSAKLLPKNSILVSTRATIGRIAINKEECSTNQGFKNIVIKDSNKVNSHFVAFMMTQLVEKMHSMATGGTFKELSKSNFESLQIPLPPLSTQEEIVAEIEGYQKIIDGARMVVENYRPQIKIDPEWEMVELGEVCEIKSGGTPSRTNENFWNGIIPWYTSGELNELYTIAPKEFISEEGLANSNTTIFPKGSLLIGMYDTAAFKMSILSQEATFNQAICGVKPNDNINLQFLYLFFLANREKYLKQRLGVRQRNLSKGFISKISIPSIPLEQQNEFVEKFQFEKNMINGNYTLIEIFEQKIKDRISEVWGTNKNEE